MVVLAQSLWNHQNDNSYNNIMRLIKILVVVIMIMILIIRMRTIMIMITYFLTAIIGSDKIV